MAVERRACPDPARNVDDAAAAPSSQGQYPSDGRALYSFDPAARRWALLPFRVDNTPAYGRYGHGFAAAGGVLYVHAGTGPSGESAEHR